MNRRNNANRQSAFTLIELLLTIAIIGVVLSILLPSLAKARAAAQITRELSAIRQVGAAYLTYTNDNKSRVMPGYLRATWSLPNVVNLRREMWVWETDQSADQSARLRGTVIRPYPWRMLPYVNFSWEALVLDRRVLADMRKLPSNPSSKVGREWALAFNPSFGMNTTYVGGDAHRGAFHAPSLRRWGAYYVKRVEQPIFPDQLITFATARGDRPGGDPTLVLPGNHRIEGPWRATPTSDSVPDFIPWTAPLGRFDPNRTPKTYGHIDFRAGNDALTVAFDGHASRMSIVKAFDMRRWSNQANAPDWAP